ncbi:MAG: hypothetical protein V3V08_15655 [Nannocystaceae bacterium]
MTDTPTRRPEPKAGAEPSCTNERWRARLRRAGRGARVCALFACAVLAPVMGRVVWEGRAELTQAKEMEVYGTFDDYVLHLGRAARWRMPVFDHDEQALERLMSLGAEHEMLGPEGTDNALIAYREARRALLATRAWAVADPDTLRRANQRIAGLMAAQERGFEMDLSGTGQQEAYHLELLATSPGPDPMRGRLAAFIFVAWAFAGVGFVLTGLDAQGRLRVPQATRWGSACLLLLGLWVYLMGPS